MGLDSRLLIQKAIRIAPTLIKNMAAMMVRLASAVERDKDVRLKVTSA
jgi:hypothetical protein